jgi:putative Mg2+ transporter-C (MgtC) family protein
LSWITGRQFADALTHLLTTLVYAHHRVRFERAAVMPEAELRTVIVDHGFSIANLSYHLLGGGKFFEYCMIIRTLDGGNTSRLAKRLIQLPNVVEFRIAPTGD